MAVNPAGTRVYVGGGDGIAVIDAVTNTVVATFGVGHPVSGLAFNLRGTLLYAAGGRPVGTVSVIDTLTNTVVATVQVGSNPHTVAVAKALF